MKENFLQFMELANADVSVQKKLEEAAKNYSGEQTEDAAFQTIIAPVAKEAGYDFTIDDMKASVQELDFDEMKQVAGGGEQAGLAATACFIIGAGFGGAGSWDDSTKSCGVCWYIGLGAGTVTCAGKGSGSK